MSRDEDAARSAARPRTGVPTPALVPAWSACGTGRLRPGDARGGRCRRAPAALAQTDPLTEAAVQSAELYRAGKVLEALPYAEEAARLAEAEFGPDDVRTANHLHAVATVYQYLGWLAFAEPLLERTFSIRLRDLGPDHPDVAQSMNNLAVLFAAQRRHTTAEEYYLGALEIWERAYGPDHPDVATACNNLAGLYYATGRFEDAEPLFLRALSIREAAFGPDHTSVAEVLISYAYLLRSDGRGALAVQLEQRAERLNTP